MNQRLEGVIDVLREGIELVAQIYHAHLHPLTHRPGLVLVGYLASSIYLLEHTIWSWKRGGRTKGVDAEVLKRWVLEDGVPDAIREVQRAKQSGPERIMADNNLVFGSNAESHHLHKVKL